MAPRTDLSVKDILTRDLPLQAYIKNLAPALTAPRRDPSARGFTKQMAKELGHLIECVKLVNMDCFHALIEGKVNPALARTVNMDEAFYNKLQVSLRCIFVHIMR